MDMRHCVLVMMAATLPLKAEALAAQPAPPAQPEAVTAPAPAVAPKPLPTADAVLTRYINATGGERAYAALRSRVAVWRLEIPVAKISGRVEVTHQTPDRMLSIITAPGLGETRHGSKPP
jgi:hypothetical protein